MHHHLGLTCDKLITSSINILCTVCVDIIDIYYVGAANLKLLDYLNMIIGSSGTDAVRPNK